MTDFITRFLAELIEKFKVANPKTFAVLALILLVLIYGAQQGSLLGVWDMPEQISDLIKWIGPFLATLLGTSTFKFLSPSSQERRAQKVH